MVKTVWSSGGGMQSAAIAALIVQGRLPAPDLAVIADTGREMSSTWEYHDAVVAPALATVGVKLHRISKDDYATVDLYRRNDILIPAFTDESGEIGKLPTYCSNEWKQRVVRRFATSHFPDVKKFYVWLGISTDEMERVKQDGGKWQPVYPLIQNRMNRGDCEALVHRIGWPKPPKSRCWMCPNQPHAQWREEREHFPADFEKAVSLEKSIRERDDTLYLHRSGKPLTEVDWSEPQMDMFTGRCDSGYCFT